MNIYTKFSYNPSFCAFRKIVAKTISDYLNVHQNEKPAFLCISRYLEFSVLENSINNSTDFVEVINLSEFVKSLEDTTTSILNYNKIEELAVKYIIEPAKRPETKWDVLNMQMIYDYEHQKFHNDIFDPYIKWKKSEIDIEDINIQQIENMSDEADRLLDLYDAQYPHAREIHDTFIVDDPWQSTRGYGEDKCMVAYLEYISDQLADLHIRKSL